MDYKNKYGKKVVSGEKILTRCLLPKTESQLPFELYLFSCLENTETAFQNQLINVTFYGSGQKLTSANGETIQIYLLFYWVTIESLKVPL